MVKRYCRVHQSVEAIRWTGKNEEEIREFVSTGPHIDWAKSLSKKSLIFSPLQVGDYILKETSGEISFMPPDAFGRAFRRIEE